ncbi:MAG: hypothetical protein ACMUHX_02495 [bacterium]
MGAVALCLHTTRLCICERALGLLASPSRCAVCTGIFSKAHL